MNAHQIAAERHLNDSLWEAVWTATGNSVPPEHIAMIVLTGAVTVLRTITTPEKIRALLEFAMELVDEEQPTQQSPAATPIKM